MNADKKAIIILLFSVWFAYKENSKAIKKKACLRKASVRYCNMNKKR